MNTKPFIAKLLAFALAANTLATGCAATTEAPDADVATELLGTSSQAHTTQDSHEKMLEDAGLAAAPYYHHASERPTWAASVMRNPVPSQTATLSVEWGNADDVDREGFTRRTSTKALAAREGWQGSYGLETQEKVPFGTTIKYRYVLELADGTKLEGAINEVAVGVRVTVGPSYDKIAERLTWSAVETMSPDPKQAASAFIEWGTSPDVDQLTNKEPVPAGNQFVLLPAMSTQTKVTPGKATFWRFVLKSASGQETRSDTQRFETPGYDGYVLDGTRPGDPCNSLGTAVEGHLRVSAHVALSCSKDIKFAGSIYTGSGQNGVLSCPKEFPYNLNYDKGKFVRLPVVGVIGPFGATADDWRSSVDVRLNAYKPGANAGNPGSSPTDRGWQKWDASNWNPSAQTARYRIFCADRMPVPGENIFDG